METTKSGNGSALRDFARRCCVAFLVLGVVSLILQTVGCFTLGWMIIDVPDYWKLHYGLWSMKMCVDDTCNTIGHGELELMTKGSWTTFMGEYQWLTATGLVLLLIALFVFPCFVCCQTSTLGIKLGAAGSVFVSILSGFLDILASAKFNRKVRELDGLLERLYDKSIMETPYSLIITGVGGALAVILALFLALTMLTYMMHSRSVPKPRQQFVMTCYPPNYAINQASGAIEVTGYPPSYAIDKAPQVAGPQPSIPDQEHGLWPKSKYKTAL